MKKGKTTPNTQTKKQKQKEKKKKKKNLEWQEAKRPTIANTGSFL